jgi:hypothetical protein
MFLDSDFNGNSWGSFEEDYSNFGSMGTTIGNTVSQIQENAQNQIDAIQEGQNTNKVIVKANNRPDSGGGFGAIINKVKDGVRDKANNVIDRTQSAQVQAEISNLNMELQTQREEAKRSNLIMYGLLGVLAIVLLKRK